MAITENTYTGNGSTRIYSFTFPYLETTDIKASLNGVVTTAYTFTNATTIQFNTAPANGVAIRIYRQTDDDQTQAEFYPGSAIRSQDLNDNFLQSLYVAQETRTDSFAASANVQQGVQDAALALSNSQTAITTANAATVTANSAASSVSTANTTANTALTTANSAVTTANSAVSTASSAVTTANNAVSTANSAVTTANTANSNATSAVNTANTANNTSNSALALVSSIVDYTIIANVAAIPASPANNTGVELLDSTSIQSFTPLTGVPAGFVGSSALRVKIKYTTTGNTWQWISYTAADPETRYVKAIGSAMTGQLLAEPSAVASTPGLAFSGDANTGMGHPGADQLSLITAGVVRLSFDAAGNATFANPVTIPTGSTVTGYLTSATAASTYQPISSMSSYLTTANAASTYQSQAAMTNYLTTATAGTTYQTIAGMSSYLTTATASSTYLTQANASSTYLTSATAATTYDPKFVHTSTSANVTIAANAWVSVLTSGLQITLPASPTDGMQVRISVGSFTDTVVLANGNRIMNDPSNLTIDVANATVTLVYDNTTLTPAPVFGWRII